MYLYKRYVDDTNCAGSKMPPGARFKEGNIVIDERQIESDEDIPADKRTAELMKEIANTICTYIQVETDYPSKNKEGRMPILDLSVEVVENNILYRHYRKEIANFQVLRETSAMPTKMKRTCLIQEAIRILRNTSRAHPDNVKNEFLSEFSLRMKESGYPSKFRLGVITCATKAYQKQLKKDQDGICPMYRPKGYQEETRRKKKEINKMSWYKPYETVLFCPPTPRSELFKQLNNIAQDSVKAGGLKIKVVERAGRSIKSLMPGLDKGSTCGRQDCFVHSSGKRGDCNAEGIVYMGTCTLCAEQNVKCTYIGESSRSCYVRGRQHMMAISNPERNRNNAFARHTLEYHPQETPQFTMEVISKFKTPLERQIAEGIEIYNSNSNITMNSKLDHYQPAFHRLIFTNQLAD